MEQSDILFFSALYKFSSYVCMQRYVLCMYCRSHRDRCPSIMQLFYKLFGVHHGHPIRLRLPNCPSSWSALWQQIRCQVEERWFVFRLTWYSLFYNSLNSSWTVVDTMLEPMFWFVDHFVRYLGPVSCDWVSMLKRIHSKHLWFRVC